MEMVPKNDLDMLTRPGGRPPADVLTPRGALGITLALGMLSCAAGLIGFTWLAYQISAQRFVAIDQDVIRVLRGFWGPHSDRLMYVLTMMGEPLVLGALVVFVALLLWVHERWIDAASLLVAMGGSNLINHLLKELFQRSRPTFLPPSFMLTSYSFPSGHAMDSLVCYGVLACIALQILPHRRQRLALLLSTALLVAGVGFSRVYFGVHFPTDVIGGFIAGAIWLIVVLLAAHVARWLAARRSML